MGRGVGGAAPSTNVIGIPPLSAKFEVVEWRRRGRGMGGGLKSHIENPGEEIMWREGWTGEGRLKSQIENAEEERMGNDGWRERESGLKLQIENADEDGIGRGGWIRQGG